MLCFADEEAGSREQQDWLPPIEFEQEQWEEVDLGKREYNLPACPNNSPAVISTLSPSDAGRPLSADGGSLKAESGMHLNSSLGLLDVSSSCKFPLFASSVAQICCAIRHLLMSWAESLKKLVSFSICQERAALEALVTVVVTCKSVQASIGQLICE